MQGIPVHISRQLKSPWLWAAPLASQPEQATVKAGKGGAKAASKAKGPKRPALVLLGFARVLELSADDSFFESEEFRLSALHASIVVRRAGDWAPFSTCRCRQQCAS